MSFINDIYPQGYHRRGAAKRCQLGIKPTLVKRGASLGTSAAVLGGVAIGEGAIVGAGSVVSAERAPWSVVAGNPARLGRAHRQQTTGCKRREEQKERRTNLCRLRFANWSSIPRGSHEKEHLPLTGRGRQGHVETSRLPPGQRYLLLGLVAVSVLLIHSRKLHASGPANTWYKTDTHVRSTTRTQRLRGPGPG